MTAQIEKWIAGSGVGLSWTDCFGSETDSIVSGNAIRSSVSITNGTGLDMFADVSFSLASINPAAGSYLGLYLYPLIHDGAKYGDDRFNASAAGPPSANYLVGVAQLVAASQIQYGEFNLPGRRSPILIPPGTFKFVLYNGASVTLGTSNTFKYRTFNRQVV